MENENHVNFPYVSSNRKAKEIVFLTRYRVFCDMTVVYEHIMVSMLLRINHTAVVTIFVSLL